MSIYDKTWSQHNRPLVYPFARMNPISRWLQTKFVILCIYFSTRDVIMARSSGNLGLVRKYSEDIVRLETWLFNLQTRG